MMTLEEAKERYTEAWKALQTPGFPSTKSFFDGYQCALRDCFPEYFGNISPNDVIKEVEARKSGKR
jgi:hypothetical protein